MKKIIALLILLPVVGFAQEVKPIKSIAIPRTDTPLPDKKPEDQTEAPQYSISKPFEPKMFKSPKKVYEAPQLENKIGMGNQPKSDLNPGASYEKKLDKQKMHLVISKDVIIFFLGIKFVEVHVLIKEIRDI